MKRNYRIKIACFLSVLSVNSNEFNKNIYASDVLNMKKQRDIYTKNILQNKRQIPWSEQHPIAAKILKALGITAALAATGAGIYYGTNFVLDEIYPERVKEREKLKNMEQKLSEINNKIADYTLKDNLSEDEEKNLEKLRKNESWLKERIENKNNNNNSNKLLNFAAVGGIVALIKGIYELTKSVGQFSKSILSFSYLKWAYSNFSEVFKDIKNYFKSPPREMQKEDFLDLFDTMCKNIYGQKKAISALRNHIFDIIVARDQAKQKGEKYSKCDILYLHGPSGVGKSLFVKLLSKIFLANGEPLIVLSSYFDTDKKESLVDQLINIEEKDSNPERMAPKKMFIDYIINNPNGLIVLEEYDKYCFASKKSSDENKSSAIDEFLRGLHDEGVLVAGGQKLEWSGTIIITSNEDDLSKHEQSFVNRIRDVKFENLTAAAYEKIIQDHFDDISAYWASPDNGGIEITLEETSLKRLALELEKKNQGARLVKNWIITDINNAIGEKIKSLIQLSDEDNEYESTDTSSINNSNILFNDSNKNEESKDENSTEVSSISDSSILLNDSNENKDDEDESTDASSVSDSSISLDNIRLIVKYENNKFLVSELNDEISNNNLLSSSNNIKSAYTES